MPWPRAAVQLHKHAACARILLCNLICTAALPHDLCGPFWMLNPQIGPLRFRSGRWFCSTRAHRICSSLSVLGWFTTIAIEHATCVIQVK